MDHRKEEIELVRELLDHIEVMVSLFNESSSQENLP